ncbi:MAG: AmmeMemoRadiSam system protein B [Desulfobacteraceae bacterium]|nr:MAG: AmmeMemoRadiSam system protein B [Desulfobacteraceae bacterium]
MFKKILYTLLILAASVPSQRSSAGDTFRAAAVAGRFYPKSAEELRLAVQGFLRDALPRTARNPSAIVVPHAGYIFSGQIAADGFKQVEGESYETVVILGANHTTRGFEKISVYNGGAFDTPLGKTEIDRTVATALLETCKECVADERVHKEEHSIEVEVPFVQVLFPKARIVPIVVGSAEPAAAARFGQALASVLKDRRALIVASSDLSHYPRASDAEDVDPKTLSAVAGLDAGRLKAAIETQMRRRIPNLATCACGEAPILASLEAAKGLGARGAGVISYAHSADTGLTGPERVVGYGSVVITREEGMTPLKERPREPAYSDRFDQSERRALLAFARESIRRYLSTGTIPLARGFGENLEQRRAVFVTLKRHGTLRGCIGTTTADTPLGRVVGMMALKSAFADPRFRPLERRELSEIEIEISILTKPQDARPEDIVTGRDGVILSKGGNTALFLPQVATEQKWDRDTMLDQLCLKAGLEKSGWREGARLSTFQAIVFGEGSERSP